MISWLDGIFNRIFSRGTALELGAGTDYLAPLSASLNPVTKRIEVTAPEGTLPEPGPSGEVLTSNGAEWVSAPATGGSGGGGMGFRYTFSTTTTDADPGAGTLRANHATLGSATALYVDLAEYGGTDVTAWLDSLDDYAGAIKGVIRLSSQSDPTKWVEYTATGWTTATGYRKLTVVYKDGPGGLLTTAGDTFVAFDYVSGNPATEKDNGNAGAAKTIDLRLNLAQKVTLDQASTVLTLTPPNGVGGFQLKVKQDPVTGGRVVGTWAATSGSIIWLGNRVPVLSTAVDAEDFIPGYFDGTNTYLAAPGEFGGATVHTSGAFVADGPNSYWQLGLNPGSGNTVNSCASTGLLRLPRGNNVLAMVRSDDDLFDREAIRWNSGASASPFGTLTFGEVNIAEARMSARLLVSWLVNNVQVLFASSTRIESILSFLFSSTVANGTFGQVSKTGATAGNRVRHGGQGTVDGAAGASRLEGGIATGTGVGGDSEVVPGTGPGGRGNCAFGEPPSSWNGMAMGHSWEYASAIPTANPTSRFYTFALSSGIFARGANGIVTTVATASSVALTNSATKALANLRRASAQATTNATPALVSIIDLSAPAACGALDGVVLTVELTVNFKQRLSSNTGSVKLIRRFTRLSGTVAAGAAATSVFSDVDVGLAAVVVDLTFSGNVVQASLTGIAATNIDYVLAWEINSSGAA